MACVNLYLFLSCYPYLLIQIYSSCLLISVCIPNNQTSSQSKRSMIFSEERDLIFTWLNTCVKTYPPLASVRQSVGFLQLRVWVLLPGSRGLFLIRSLVHFFWHSWIWLILSHPFWRLSLSSYELVRVGIYSWADQVPDTVSVHCFILSTS